MFQLITVLKSIKSHVKHPPALVLIGYDMMRNKNDSLLTEHREKNDLVHGSNSMLINFN